MEEAQANQEQQDFPGPVAATYAAVRSANYSLPGSPYNAPAGPHYSSRLLNATGLSQGPTKTITAQRGDKLRLTAYGLYNDTGTGYNITQPPATSTGVLSGAALFLSTGPRVGPVEETTQPTSSGLQRSLSQVAVGISVPLLARDYLKADAQEASASLLRASGPPDAYLYYDIYKASDGTPVRSGKATLQPTSGISWQPLTLDVEITEDYPVLVEIATKNNDTEVAAYFDDLVVEYTPGPVIEENSYYAYGERLDGLSWRRMDERLYGRGYQGQNTTKDAETGYTAFDLRLYDTRYGRWLMGDPMRQHASGYVGMGNNPVSRVDPNGGFDWFKGSDNKMHFDANVHSQNDLPQGATYAGTTASRPMADGFTWMGWSDGTETVGTGEVSVVGHHIVNEGGLSHEEVVGWSNFADAAANGYVVLLTTPLQIAATAEVGTGYLAAKMLGSAAGQYVGAGFNKNEIDVADVVFDGITGNSTVNAGLDAAVDFKPFRMNGPDPVLSSPFLGNKSWRATGVEFSAYTIGGIMGSPFIDSASHNMPLQTGAAAVMSTYSNFEANEVNTAWPW